MKVKKKKDKRERKSKKERRNLKKRTRELGEGKKSISTNLFQKAINF